MVVYNLCSWKKVVKYLSPLGSNILFDILISNMSTLELRVLN
jgi:hypothetical protein